MIFHNFGNHIWDLLRIRHLSYNCLGLFYMESPMYSKNVSLQLFHYSIDLFLEYEYHSLCQTIAIFLTQNDNNRIDYKVHTTITRKFIRFIIAFKHSVAFHLLQDALTTVTSKHIWPIADSIWAKFELFICAISTMVYEITYQGQRNTFSIFALILPIWVTGWISTLDSFSFRYIIDNVYKSLIVAIYDIFNTYYDRQRFGIFR